MSCFFDTECFGWVHAMYLGMAVFCVLVVAWCVLDKSDPPELSAVRAMRDIARAKMGKTWDERRAIEEYKAFARRRQAFSVDPHRPHDLKMIRTCVDSLHKVGEVTNAEREAFMKTFPA